MTKPTKATRTSLARPPSTRRSSGAGTASERLVNALVDRGAAYRGIDVGRTISALDSAVDRASRELRTQGRADDLRRLLDLASSPTCVTLLDAASNAGEEDRAISIDAAKRYVAACVEHQVESPTALQLVLDFAVWAATAFVLFIRSVAKGTATDDETIRLHDRASTRASQSLAQGLALEREARASKPKPAFAWVTAPALPAAPPDEPPSDEPEEPGEPEDAGAGHGFEPDVDAPDDGSVACAHEDSPDDGGEPPEAGTLPSGVALGGRWGASPAFAILGVDPTTLRAAPTRGRTAPGAEARAEMAKRGLRWDALAGNWTKGDDDGE